MVPGGDPCAGYALEMICKSWTYHGREPGGGDGPAWGSRGVRVGRAHGAVLSGGARRFRIESMARLKAYLLHRHS